MSVSLCIDLEECLRKGFTAMAAVLQQDERVKKDIQMCRTCSNNIGCYECTNCGRMCRWHEDPRYCRECVLKDDRFCKVCHDYLCPSCFERGLYSSCEKCGGIECRSFPCPESFLIWCESCHRKKCEACVYEDGEDWSVWSNCPTCAQQQANQQD